MLTKPLIIKDIEEVPVGSLLCYPHLGDGLLAISAKYDGQNDRTTVIVPLSGKNTYTRALQAIQVEYLSGTVAILESVKAEVDISSSTNSNSAAVFIGKSGTYIQLRSERLGSFMQQCLRLEDGVIRTSPPSDSVAFGRWRIVSEDDPSEELWSSDLIDNER